MRERFGQPAVNVARAALSDAILAQVRWAGIEVSFGKRLVRIEDLPDRPIAAHFEDGTMAEGDLLIGADGVHSSVRAHVNPGGPVHSIPASWASAASFRDRYLRRPVSGRM